MNIAAQNHVLVVPSGVTMRGISSFASQLFEACRAHHHILLDVDGVEEADLSFLQTVSAAEKYMRDKGGVLALARPADAVLGGLLHAAGFARDAAHLDFWFHGELPQ